MSPPLREVVLSRAALTRPEPRFDAAAGGVVEFYGVVRGQEGPEAISGIDYEAHMEMARHQFDLLVKETCERFPVHGLTVHHRVGFVAVGEPSLFLRVSAAHRGPAFAAAEWFVDEMKQRVPIWKHPVSQTTGAEVESVGAAMIPNL